VDDNTDYCKKSIKIESEHYLLAIKLSNDYIVHAAISVISTRYALVFHYTKIPNCAMGNTGQGP
jgi:hypothetical protein